MIRMESNLVTYFVRLEAVFTKDVLWDCQEAKRTLIGTVLHIGRAFKSEWKCFWIYWLRIKFFFILIYVKKWTKGEGGSEAFFLFSAIANGVFYYLLVRTRFWIMDKYLFQIQGQSYSTLRREPSLNRAENRSFSLRLKVFDAVSLFLVK